MFDCDTDPDNLQRCLERFIQRWYGSHISSLGISAEKLVQTHLPQPLTWLYGYAGAWPGRYYWDTIFGNQGDRHHASFFS